MKVEEQSAAEELDHRGSCLTPQEKFIVIPPGLQAKEIQLFQKTQT